MAADDAKDTSAIAPNASVVRQIIAVLRCDEDVFQPRPKGALLPSVKRLMPVIKSGICNHRNRGRCSFAQQQSILARPCPLYPQKRTCVLQLGMSALGQKR